MLLKPRQNSVRAALTLRPWRREKASRAQLCSLIAKRAVRMGAMRDESFEHTADIPGSKCLVAEFWEEDLLRGKWGAGVGAGGG